MYYGRFDKFCSYIDHQFCSSCAQTDRFKASDNIAISQNLSNFQTWIKHEATYPLYELDASALKIIHNRS